MTVTVSGLNYTQLAACDQVTGDTGVGGNWTGDSPVPDSVTYKENGTSIAGIIKSTSGIRYLTFTPTSSQDLSGTIHMRFWFLSTLGGNIATKASGGIMFYATDGSNTGYWYLDGRDTYEGGWKNMVVDLSQGVDSGTKPTMTAITAFGIGMNLDTAGKNTETVWIDHFNISDGLMVYGDDGGGYFDFEDIYQGDVSSGYGIITKFGGTYFLTGEVQFGDTVSTNACKFQAKNQTVIFEDRGTDINSSLMGFTISDNGTGTTEFILGEKSGTAGISGCVIRIASTSQSSKFFVDATDTDIDNFKLYGSSFLDATGLAFPSSDTNVEILNCSFEACGTILPDTAKVESCNFISADNIGVSILSTSHGVKDCTFISCPSAIEFSVASTSYALDGVVFIGGDGVTYFDIENSNNATTCDSYSESNQDTDQNVGNDTSNAAGQSFAGNNGVLSRARLWLKAVSSPTGNAVCKIYASTGSDPNRTPTGSALATSNTVDVSTIGATYEAVDFEFEDEYTLASGTTYFLVLEYDGDSSNYLHWGTDTSSPSHTSNNFAVYTTSWSAASTTDGCFYVYTGGIVKIALSNGANPAYDLNSGTPPGATIMPISLTLTLTDLVATSEVRILDTSDNILDGIESCGTTFAYNYVYSPATTIRIVVLHESYKFIRFEYVLLDSNQNLPIQYITDVNYSNP